MDPSSPSPHGRAWAALERGLLVALLGAMPVMAGIWCTRSGGWRDDSLPLAGRPPGQYANKLDPNTASWMSLACLPGIGEQRGKDIVAYRDRHRGPGPAFRQPADLAKVRNIGPKTVERIAPFLWFPPPETPSTSPQD